MALIKDGLVTLVVWRLARALYLDKWLALKAPDGSFHKLEATDGGGLLIDGVEVQGSNHLTEFFMQSPNSTWWRFYVDDDGVLQREQVL